MDQKQSLPLQREIQSSMQRTSGRHKDSTCSIAQNKARHSGE